MADKPYKVTFNWSGESLDKGKLVAVSCDEENVPGENGFFKSIIDFWTQTTIINDGEAKKAALAVNKVQTLQLQRGGFLYMDVGCWLKGTQTFGLAWKDEAAVCSYTPSSVSGGGTAQENLLNSFVQSVPGVSLLKSKKKIPGKYTLDANTLYLILPDMHVPDAPPLSVPRPFDDGSWGKNKFGSYAEDPNTWDQLNKHDLFDSRQSIEAMVTFLSAVSGLSWVKQIALVQIGDMYELWAARPCLLKKTPEANPYIEIISNAKELYYTPQQSVEAIAGWIGHTHILFPRLFGAFDACACAKTFLYGNHDQLLDQTGSDRGGKSMGAERAIACTSSSPSTVYDRQQNVLRDGIFIEHGQRVDGFNRDGETSGFGMANKAANSPYIKKHKNTFDPTRRETFVAGAAAAWMMNKARFGLYVQGHTHEADLNYVDVFHRREDTQVVYGADGPIFVTTHNSL